MRPVFILAIFFLCESCTQHLTKEEISILEFSYSDSYEEILSCRVDSGKIYLISINDTLAHGILTDSISDRFERWQETIKSNPEKYREITDCENCPELVVKIINLQDSLVFVRHGQPDNETKQIIQFAKRLYTKNKQLNSSQGNFETRLLIKPKPPAIVPVNF